MGILDQNIEGSEDVILSVGGTPFTGWEEIEVTKNLESISGGFSLKIFDKWRESMSSWTIKPGDSCIVKIGREPIITGYVDAVESDFSKDSHSIAVKGRDRAADLVDCSILGTESQFRNKTMTELATIFCEPFGITVTADTDVGKPFKKWDVQQGESVFENLDRMAKLRGVLVISDNTGNIKIVRAGQDRASDAIVQGENIETGFASFDNTNRFSKYLTKGQSAGNDQTNGAAAAHNKFEATDAGITRYRPLVIVSEGSSDKETVKNRAQWEATVRAAKAFRFDTTIPGWRQSNGDLWKINQRVRTTAQLGGVDQDLLISNLSFRKDNTSGTVTKLQLVRPDAYKPKVEISSGSDPVSGFRKKKPTATRSNSWWADATKT